MFNDCFIAGIETPEGLATYHVKLKYWDIFNISEIAKAPFYDQHSADDVIKRIFSLTKSKLK